MYCDELRNAVTQDIHNRGSIPEGPRRTSEVDVDERAGRSQPPSPTGSIRPPVGQVVRGGTTTLGPEGRLCAGTPLQGGSVYGGHRSDGAAGPGIGWRRPEPDRTGHAANRGGRAFRRLVRVYVRTACPGFDRRAVRRCSL